MNLRTFGIRLSATAAAALTIAAGPATAATTYAWPVQLSQPLSVSELPYASTGYSIVLCNLPIAPAGTYQGVAVVPFPQTNGPVSYNGTLSVSIAGAGAPRAPRSGDIVTCVLRVKLTNTFANMGTVATFTLP